MTDAEHLKYIRKQLHLTQGEMADRMGYSSQQVISAIETGKRLLSGPARQLLKCIEENELS